MRVLESCVKDYLVNEKTDLIRDDCVIRNYVVSNLSGFVYKLEFEFTIV